MESAAGKLTEPDYLKIDRAAELKSEFHDGEMFAKSGGTLKHSRLATRLAHLLQTALAGKPCEVFNSDVRVGLPDGDYCYPDVSGLCARPETNDQEDVLLNPSMIVEVLSPSTEAYDRGAKFRAYRQLPSLTDYLFISQDQRLVEHYEKREDEWILHEHAQNESRILLHSLRDLVIKLGDLYEGILD